MKTNIIVALAAMVAILFAAGCTQLGSSAGSGRLVLGIKDAAADMGGVSSIMVTIDSVQLFNSSNGWTTLSSTPKTFDLMKLKAEGSTALLADMQVPAGTYQQVRLHISKVTVTDASGTHDAKLPSGDLKIIGDITVNANATATATFDFVADESLHRTGNGRYILAPVIKIETRENSTAEIESGEKVKIWGGSIRSSSRVGMDIEGNVGEGREIGRDEDLSVAEDGKIRVNVPSPKANINAKGRVIVGITDAAGLANVTSVQVTVGSVEAHSSEKGWAALSSTPKTYDLLRLDAEDKVALLADMQVPVGTYQQIRLQISKVTVTDASGTHDAKLPSGELRIIGELEVKENSTATATLDFIAVESLYRTGNGNYIFAPVVKFETRHDAETEVASDGRVSIRGGSVRSSSRAGMDIDGNFGEGRKIAPGLNLTVEWDGKIRGVAYRPDD